MIRSFLPLAFLITAVLLSAGAYASAETGNGLRTPEGIRATAFADIPPKPILPGTVFRDCPHCPEMVVVPAGSFVMGRQADDKTARLGPRHEVRIAQHFAAGRFEVTVAQWEACVADGACVRTGQRDSIRIHRLKGMESAGLRAPVTRTDWGDAKSYVEWLSHKTGKRYRLLSEAEWEYAARVGTTTPWFCGADASCLDEVAWYAANSGNLTHPVGAKRANAFGLHDVHGSLWEWVEDCWHPDYRGAPSDGSAWTTGGDCSRRVLRGGSWGSTAWTLRIANRFAERENGNTLVFGIRVARTLAQ